MSAAVSLVGLSNSTLIEASAALTRSVFLACSCNQTIILGQCVIKITGKGTEDR